MFQAFPRIPVMWNVAFCCRSAEEERAGEAMDARLAFFATRWPWKASRDAAIAREIQDYWTSFARSGDPNGKDQPPWSEFGAAGSVLDFADSTRMAELPDRA